MNINSNIPLVLTAKLHKIAKYFKKKNFMAPFYGWGSTASRLEPLRGGSLLFPLRDQNLGQDHQFQIVYSKLAYSFCS